MSCHSDKILGTSFGYTKATFVTVRTFKDYKRFCIATVSTRASHSAEGPLFQLKCQSLSSELREVLAKFLIKDRYMNKSISKLAKEDPEVLQRRKERFLALEIKESQSNPASPTKQKRTKSDSSSNIAQSSNKKAKKDQAKKTLRIPEGQHQGDARALIQKQQANKQAHLPQRIIGKSSALDKQYLRLTSEVDPHTVRPISVLKASLAKVTSTYHSNHDYEEACDQLRSIRQDLTVQGIANPFTVQIYELHARLALENGDICQYQQCR